MTTGLSERYKELGMCGEEAMREDHGFSACICSIQEPHSIHQCVACDHTWPNTSPVEQADGATAESSK